MRFADFLFLNIEAGTMPTRLCKKATLKRFASRRQSFGATAWCRERAEEGAQKSEQTLNVQRPMSNSEVSDQTSEVRGGENDEARMTNDEGMTKHK